jgi:membrane protease YdiL (CAAX protease family)
MVSALGPGEGGPMPRRADVVPKRSAAIATDLRRVHLLLAAIAVTVVAHSVLLAAGISEVGTLVANGSAAAALLAMAGWSGIGRGELGITAGRRGVVAAALGSAAVVAIVAGATLMGLLPESPELAHLSRPAFWFRALVAIPVGTAVCEEVIFRGVLFAACTRVLRTRWAIVMTSAAFGLWHVAAEADRVGAASVPAILPGVVATASASAFVLSPLRRGTGDLVAPIALHATTNVAVFTAVVLTSRPFG